MDDQEFLDYVEKLMFAAMLNGCYNVDWLDWFGYTDYGPGSWSVSLSADEVARLLYMVRGKNNG